MIIVDVHEPKTLLSLLESKDAEFKRDFLEVGDYILSGGIGIERKRGPDFLHSIIDGRLWDQVSNLSQFEHPVICIVSSDMWKDMYFSKDRYIHNRFYGAISTLISKFNISVLTFDTDEDFIDFLVHLDKKVTSNKISSRPTPFTRKPKTLKERKENVLSMVEGVSIKKAQVILNKFGTIKNVANASIDSLMEVDGIGKKLAENIFKTFN